jgi:hypothetical protein
MTLGTTADQLNCLKMICDLLGFITEIWTLCDIMPIFEKMLNVRDFLSGNSFVGFASINIKKRHSNQIRIFKVGAFSFFLTFLPLERT